MQGKFLGALCSIVIFAGACSDPSEIGLVLDPGSNQIGVFYEEIPLSSFLVLEDSFNTTNQSRLVVGGDHSDLFGTTESIGYSRLSFNPNGVLPEDNAIFDSAIFAFNIVDLIGEDFDEAKEFKVHRLLEEIEDTTYYSFSSLDFDMEETLAEGSFLLTPDTVNQVSMDLNEDFAAELFGKLTSQDPVFDNIFAFREYFPGIVIKGNPDQNTSVSMAIGSGTGITMYYHYEDDTVSTAYPINTIQSRHFNQVISDRQGTPTEVITETNVVYDVAGDKVGVKAGLGMMTQLDMSPLHEFLDTLENVTFNQILLEVGPVDEYPEGKNPYGALVMYFADGGEYYRRFDGVKVAVQGENNSQTGLDQDGNIVPITSNQNGLAFNTETRVYSNQITSYVDAMYRSGLVKTDLFLYPNTPSTESGVVTFDAFKRSLKEFVVDKDQIKMKIYYSKIR
ncbi:hypothetical protein Cycma_1307 [Cyclobacterium marinum DSM 745]|uniref:DUF4270 domain-containing protein n=1 Tax=Cyclobacterium marinum (strain ATCC 25205 / DSM 745 / LMG 13164 / NCIMB 1802) TaxID=880070 RepID=G0J0V2_CYCMS|nr:hypothetical protein Cycma_1307 [Cyclobacterium marinum DSM 745]MBI0401451.1 hypothetical protein [Cyclobacterium marinum]